MNIFVKKNDLSSISRINFENVNDFTRGNKYPDALLINTLPKSEQHFLISKTLLINEEVDRINELLSTGQKNAVIFIYGKNSHDNTIYAKYEQLCNLGFTNCHVYDGGMFEWLLLQDVYGLDEFPTTNTPSNCCLDYIPSKKIIKLK